jgi:hypothetical protein
VLLEVEPLEPEPPEELLADELLAEDVESEELPPSAVEVPPLSAPFEDEVSALRLAPPLDEERASFL